MEFEESINELKKIMDKGGVTRPHVLFNDGEEVEFKLKSVITGRIADRIIELSAQYPLDLFDLMTVQLNEFVIKNPDGKISDFVNEYKYTTYQYSAYNDADKLRLGLLDSRKNVIKERRDVLYKILIETIDYKELDAGLWKLMNGKGKVTKEFWLNQDLEMLEEIYRSFSLRIQ